MLDRCDKTLQMFNMEKNSFVTYYTIKLIYFL